jgi:hypothetical protein
LIHYALWKLFIKKMVKQSNQDSFDEHSASFPSLS